MAARDNKWLTVVGVGPGDPSWLTPAAYQAVAEAEILVGGPRALHLFAFLDREKRVIDADLETLYQYLKQVRGQPTAVLVSGDPGLYSILGWLRARFPVEEIRVIPGISSVQMAFARLGRGWEGAIILSLHGRPLNLLDGYLSALSRKEILLALLTGGNNTPAEVGRYFTAKGLGKLKVWVGAQLGGPEERVAYLSARELADSDFDPVAVIVSGYE